MSKPPTVCYVGITDPDFSRTRVHIRALRTQGIEVTECFDASGGVTKFIRLWRTYRETGSACDVVIVAAASYLAVPFVRFISRKPIIFDAGWSLFEGVVISRGQYRHNPFGRAYVWMIDWLAATSATMVLLETEAQADFYSRLLRVSRAKCRRVFTGVDESKFRFSEVQKRPEFTVLFRGKWMAEAGIECAIEAARLLQEEDIRLCVMSPGYVPKEKLLANVEVDPTFYPWEELCKRMLECHVSLGQLASHERLERTIPHKAFESMALRIPYVTARDAGISELLTDGRDCLMVEPGFVQDIVRTIRLLAADPERRRELAANAADTYDRKCSERVLGEQLVAIIRALVPRSC